MDRFRDARQPDRAWWHELWPDPGDVLRDLGLDAGDALADVGCGNGHFTIPAAEVVAPAPVYAVDLDGTVLDEVEALAYERGVENVVTVSGDARELSSLLANRVDAVLVAETLHGVEAPTAFAEQASRSLRPGGRVLVVNWRDRPREETTVQGAPRGPPTELRMSPEETRAVMGPAGFDAAREVDLPPYHYGLAFRRSHDT